MRHPPYIAVIGSDDADDSLLASASATLGRDSPGRALRHPGGVPM